VPAPLSILEQAVHFLAREHSGPPDGEVRGRTHWYGSQLSEPDWLHSLSDAAVAAFERAIVAAKDSGIPINDLGREHAPLPTLQARINDWRDELLNGRGFLVLRGVPVDRWSVEQRSLFMRVLGLQFGRLGLVNPQGDVIGQVRNTLVDMRDLHARKYAMSDEFRFHCDASDIVGLLCVSKAESGGESRVASSVTVYNELLKRRPRLAMRLFEPVRLALRNEQQEGTAGIAEIVPCAYANGVLRTFYISDYFRDANWHRGATLPAEDLELFDLYEALATSREIGLRFTLEPGDVQLLHNHTTLHARTPYRDTAAKQRVLLRFLVSVGA